MWTCPTCHRSFVNTNQDHSCLVTDIESHFINTQENVRQTFDKILQEVLKLDNVRISPVKNAILFSGKSHFLAVKPKKKCLDIEFLLEKKIDEFPIHKTVQASKFKWAHFVRLENVDEVDDVMIDWIKRAYWVSNP